MERLLTAVPAAVPAAGAAEAADAATEVGQMRMNVLRIGPEPLALLWRDDGSGMIDAE